MSSAQHDGKPVFEAEATLQVVNVLRQIEQRFDDGHWVRGQRFAPGGGTCLVGAIDQSTEWALPGVAEEVTRQLASALPHGLRTLARMAPRAVLMAYNDWPGGHRRARRLVTVALVRLGVPVSPIVTHRAPDQGQPHISVRVPRRSS